MRWNIRPFVLCAVLVMALLPAGQSRANPPVKPETAPIRLKAATFIPQPANRQKTPPAPTRRRNNPSNAATSSSSFADRWLPNGRTR
jgi:hypothetical protein